VRSRFRITLVALLAVFAASAVAAATASAKNPTWTVCKAVTAGSGKFEDSLCSKGGKGNWEASELLTGETKEISSEQNGTQRLLTVAGTILCGKFKTEPGAEIVGGEPGTIEEVIVYEECDIEGIPNCSVGTHGVFTTNTLLSKLVYLTKAAAEKENAEATGTLLKPKTGKVLATVPFGSEDSSECTLLKGNKEVTGELVAENVKAGLHATKQEFSFPEPRVATYWVQVGKTLQEEEVKPIRWGGTGGTFDGNTFYKLTSNQAFWIF
jgi:hypothetical protein